MSGVWVRKAGVEFGVELGSGEEEEPKEKGDACAEGAVDLGVIGEPCDVPAEGNSGDKPQGGGEDGTGKDAFPGLLHRRSHVIDETDDADAAGKGDDPADEKSCDEDGGAGGGN